MNKSLGNIGDLFPDKNIRCRVRGCSNSWQMAGEDAVKRLASKDPELPERMCEDCYQKYLSLKDQEVACSKPGCENTWKWSRFQQLAAAARGHGRPPRHLCPDCQKGLNDLTDKEMPCRMKGCDQTWIWSRQQQMAWEKEKPPTRLCQGCFSRLKQYQDREFDCRVHGCDKKWVWSAYQQLEHDIRGKDPEKPPRRMCQDCAGKLRSLQDKELPCKIRECSRRWQWSAYAQLEYLITGKSLEDVPQRLCKECFDFYRQAQDVQRSCKMKGCNGTWIYGKGWQLRDWLKGREHPPSMMCDDCRRHLKELAPLEKPCAVPGCEGVWVYEPGDQLKDERSGRREPRTKRCAECETFLHDHSFENIPCEGCQKEILWSPYEQLLVAKGTFSKPALCADCGGKNLPECQPLVPVMTEHHPVVRIPAGGRWSSDPAIAAWPARIDHTVIEKAEKADIRIVALGDDLTWSNDDIEKSWPFLLEQKLNEKLADSGRTAVVINAAIPGTNSRQGLVRFERDVLPFKPDITLVSFAYGDSTLDIRGDRWRPVLEDDDAEKAMAKLMKRLKQASLPTLYWSTNPMFPEERELPKQLSGWAQAQEARKSHMLAHALHICKEENVPVLELRARFEVNGKSSAKKWMADWLNHNATGANNIAAWMCGELVKMLKD